MITPAYVATHPARFNLQISDTGLDYFGSFSSGGKLVDIPELRIRFFSIPGIRKREVRLTITKFILGSHFHVRMVEEDDFYWDARRDEFGGPHWRKPWDNDVDGRHFDTQYVRAHFIEPWVQRTWAEHFSDATHYLERETLGATLYGRDGD